MGNLVELPELPANALPRTEELPTCPICDSSASKDLGSCRDRLHGLPGEFRLVRCAECSLVRLSPRPVASELHRYYPSDGYYSYRVPETLSSGSRLAALRERVRDTVLDAMGYPVRPLATWQRLVQPAAVRLVRRRALYTYEGFPRYRAGGRALDIGCGSGIYLSFLRRHGWEVAGVDLSPAAAEAARTGFGIEVFPGPVEEAPFAPESFDHIQMSHVIEHLPDPAATMKHVARLLRPGGTLYVETPNLESFGRRTCGPYWFSWDTPRHLFLFSAPTLRRVLEPAGFRVTRMSTYMFDGLFHLSETYRREEEEGYQRKGLPDTARRRAAAATVRAFAASLSHRVNPLDGDLLACWAAKATAP